MALYPDGYFRHNTRVMRFLSFALALLTLAVGGGCFNSRRAVARANRSIEVPGPQHDGSVLLPNLWSLRPAGQQIVLGDFPVNVAVHPGGRFAAVLHAGHSQHEIVIVDLATNKITSRVSLDETFYGLEFSRNGNQLFSSGAGSEVIHSFAFKDGYLSEHHEIKLRPIRERGVPSGIALPEDARRVFVANVWGHRITEVDLDDEGKTREVFLTTNKVASTNFIKPPDDPDLAATTKRDAVKYDPTLPGDPFPYACRLDEKRQLLYVSLWAKAQIAVIDLKSNQVITHWPTEEHPNEMILSSGGKLLYVANANRNTVTVLDTQTGRALETIRSSMEPDSLPGSTPNSLALTPDGKILFVANANNNTVAVFDVANPGKSRSLGFIPVGWYPTSVRVTPDGRHLLVANGKGIIPKANRFGPQPGVRAPASTVEYIGSLFRGTLSVIALPPRPKFEQQLAKYTAQAFACRPSQSNRVVRASDNPVPARVGDPSPIQYVIYIIKENRTYDQVLGDMPEGNGDPSLCLFPERVTPNHHKLAREFVLLDNFYVESEVSADGHEWTMGAYATDFVEKFWPLSYGHNKLGKYPYPAEGNLLIAAPAGGYLWDRAREAGVTYRSYGEWVSNGKTARDPGKARVKALEGHIDPWFRGFDMDYPDVKRAERFIDELKRFEREGEMPRLQMVRLPNDHTSGTTTNKPTPTAHVADNDLAFGMLIEALSKSRFWPRTAVFVVEDDAQNGPDHIDAHRTIAYVISPYARRGAVDSTMYSTSSMLRTMELILGLKPMSQFDAAATPMFGSFQGNLDARPYEFLHPRVNMKEKNKRTAWGADHSRKMDFSKEDAADDLLLNEVVWRSVRGPESPMPAPTRAAFVFPHPKDKDDEEE